MQIPINIKTGSLLAPTKHAESSNNKPIVGIDLGTTNSLVAYIDPQSKKAITIADQAGNKHLVPSILHFATSQNILVGEEALPYLATKPQHTLYSVKRLMGKSYKDIAQYADFFGYQIIDDQTDKLVKIRVEDRFYTPIELAALLLKALKKRAEAALQQPISKTVITVPAYFNDAQRQATRDAGKLAGLEVLRIINEPTAAALAYGIGNHTQTEQAETVAVYDLGGGTFDISILHIQNGVFEVLATNGDTFLGGDDIDQAIINYWLQRNNLEPEIIKTNKKLTQTLRLWAENTKKKLSDTHNTAVQDKPDLLAQHELLQNFDASLSLAELEHLATPLIERTLNCCKQALADAQLKPQDINKVIMVGGSTRIPFVKQQVGKLFQTEVFDKLNPDEVVAIGAAVQADILAGNQHDMLLLDVTPLSMGIETMGGLMDVIVPRNTKIPLRASRQYTTQKDGQSGINIAVYQGERDLVQNNRKLGEFILRGIPAMPAGLPKVEITFTIDADGITRVKAQELRSGIEQHIEVKPQYGLSEEEMAQMLLDSLQNAQQDRQQRTLQEAINEATTLAETAKIFIVKHKNILSQTEIEHTQQHITTLLNYLDSQDKDLIHKHIEVLNNFTRPFAERVMDIAVATALRGKKIE